MGKKKKRYGSARYGTQKRAAKRLDPFGASYAGLNQSVGESVGESAFTGSKIVTLLSDDPDDKKKVLQYLAGRDVKDVMQVADFSERAFNVKKADACDAMVLDHLPIIVLNDSPNVQAMLFNETSASASDNDVRRMFVIEDELKYFPCCSETGFGQLVAGSESNSNTAFQPAGDDSTTSRANRSSNLSPYQRGYLRGIQTVVNEMLGDTGGKPQADPLSIESQLSPAAVCFQDSTTTWGLQATAVSASGQTGRGIKVAILDTGFEFGHADQNFVSRVIGNESFVGGTASDHHGHGTHVAGTACGPKNPGMGIKRYGVAGEAEMLIGRVLGPSGGDDRSILLGINWAIDQGCDLINMSFAPRVCRLDKPFSVSHEMVAQTALRNGVLMIAAAGNNSQRPNRICPVVGPAAAPSIIAVAAVNHCGGVANFSNQGSGQLDGGEINFAAPGVNVFSAWKNPIRHKSDGGTSMAAPHVTGIAALVAQETGLRGLDLFQELHRRVANIGGDTKDVGLGFIRADVRN